MQRSGACTTAVQTGLTGDKVVTMEDLETFRRWSDCDEMAFNNVSCSVEVQALNCTGRCYINEDQTEAFALERGASLWLLGALLTCMAVAGVFFGAFLCCLGPVCRCLEEDERGASSVDSCFVCIRSVSCTPASPTGDHGEEAMQATRCWSCCFLLLGIIVFASGAGMFSKAGGDQWDKATCNAAPLQRGVICSIALNTGDQVLSLNSQDALQSWLETNNCNSVPSNSWSVSNAALPCEYQSEWWDCTGNCWINKDKTEVFGYPGGGFGTFLLAFIVKSLSFILLALYITCCSCRRLVPLLYPGHSSASGKKVDPIGQSYGVSVQDAGATPLDGASNSKSGVDITAMLRTVDRGLACARALVDLLACLGALIGLFIAVFLYWVSQRFELSATICLPGLTCSFLFIVIDLFIAQCGLPRLRARAATVLNEAGAASGNKEEAQAKMVQLFVDHLNSKAGKAYAEKMSEFGVSVEALDRVLRLPPEQVPSELLGLVGLAAIARILCVILEELMIAEVEYYEQIYEMIYLGCPALMVLLVLVIAQYAVAFSPSVGSGVIGLLYLASYGSLYLKYYKSFFFCVVLLVLANIVLIVHDWFATSFSILSFVLVLLAIVLLMVSLATSSIHFYMVQPFFEASKELAVEEMRCMVYSGLGLERDTKDLEAAYAKWVKACGRLELLPFDALLPPGLEVAAAIVEGGAA
eukprot:TRINITY_DN37373_c0_g1_i1.p1 TRINITY_DN37373_c0_g1~~TRINITY_DN37373_c0_g1_i1.p1  ORF type:complete len:770 (+),score=83.63 TRINITY_DN37373_c0_g1_i1:217-2310(+)